MAARPEARGIDRNRARLARRKPPADFAHLAKRVVFALCRPPGDELRFEVMSWLSSERGIGGIAFASAAMATRAGWKTASRVALAIEAPARRIGRSRRRQGGRKRGIIVCHSRPVAIAQLQCNCPHGRVIPPPIRIIVELSVKIARVQSGEARAVLAVTFPRKAMAGETGCRCAAVAAAERDRLAVGAEAIAVGRRVASH
ncbi:hypothetical protein [Sphingopyxis sp. PAMC25046]|uniref:hypothetical protein n=1 Tax=Sphingopyxis sp. PAMC25046 TaxID=2565556 RepID=UPI001FFBAD3C|nr:hypothetical protein [Sphingopyxis sp. PAMC25046]